MATKQKQRQTFFPAVKPRDNEDQDHRFIYDSKGKIVLIKPINLKARNGAQRHYIKALHGEAPFVIGTGPAGTGKTFAACLYALDQLVLGNIDKIILTRPLVNVGEEEVGTLPGDIIQKVAPWCIPLLDIFKEYLGAQQVKTMLEREILEIAPLAFMRGRTLKRAIVLLDEAQNCLPTQVKMVLTRVDESARIFITGDIEQTDRSVGDNGLRYLLNKLSGTDNPDFEVIEFARRDVVRHPAIERVLAMFED